MSDTAVSSVPSITPALVAKIVSNYVVKKQACACRGSSAYHRRASLVGVVGKSGGSGATPNPSRPNPAIRHVEPRCVPRMRVARERAAPPRSHETWTDPRRISSEVGAAP
jgi:hypothetical protein